MATHYSTEFFQGEKIPLRAVIKKGGVVQDISDLTVANLRYRLGVEGNPNAIDLTLGDGIVLEGDGTDGAILITLEDSTTAVLAAGYYLHQLQIDDDGGLGVGIVFSGQVRVHFSLMEAA